MGHPGGFGARKREPWFFLITVAAMASCDAPAPVTVGERAATAAVSEKLHSDPNNLEPTAGGATALTLQPAPQLEVAARTAASTLPTASDEQCSELLERTPRGLSCMHCLQPQARTQARILTDILLRSCLKNIAISYLVDGSFSYDEEFLIDEIDRLTANGRQLFLHLYLSNGPSQRRWRTTNKQGLGLDMSPADFRERLGSDSLLRHQVRLSVERIAPMIREANRRGAQVSLVLALEDNLTDRAFEILGDLVSDALPPDVRVSLGRNPCPRCYRGNGNRVPSGYFREAHRAVGVSYVRDGVITNDGFPEMSDVRDVSEIRRIKTQRARLRDESARANNIFILWSAERQGLQLRNSKLTGSSRHPSKRSYQVPSAAQQQELIDFLRR